MRACPSYPYITVFFGQSQVFLIDKIKNFWYNFFERSIAPLKEFRPASKNGRSPFLEERSFIIVKGSLMIAGCAVVGILLGSIVARNVDREINT